MPPVWSGWGAPPAVTKRVSLSPWLAGQPVISDAAPALANARKSRRFNDPQKLLSHFAMAKMPPEINAIVDFDGFATATKPRTLCSLPY
jgi:hypothetical protein